MQLTIATATAIALAYARSTFAALNIDTPMGLVQCQPSLLAWHEGSPPYYLSIIPGSQPGANPLKTFDATNDVSHTWIVDIASGTVVFLQLKDATGAVAYSDRVTIQASQDNTCNPAAAPAPAPAPAASAAPPANGASLSPPPPAPASQPPAAPAISSPAAQAPSPPPTSRPTGSQAAVASSSAKPSSGAIRASVANGFAGLLAVLGVALF